MLVTQLESSIPSFFFFSQISRSCPFAAWESKKWTRNVYCWFFTFSKYKKAKEKHTIERWTLKNMKKERSFRSLIGSEWIWWFFVVVVDVEHWVSREGLRLFFFLILSHSLIESLSWCVLVKSSDEKWPLIIFYLRPSSMLCNH